MSKRTFQRRVAKQKLEYGNKVFNMCSEKLPCENIENIDGCAAVNKIVADMKETFEQQNRKICDLLAEHTVLLNELLDRNKAVNSVMKIFPINSESKLHELEKLLESQRDLYVRYIKSVLKGDIYKNLGNILGRDVVMAFNAEGVQGKKRLKDLENVYNAIIDAICGERPEEQFRAALLHAKRKYHKISSREKCNKRQNHKRKKQ